MTISQERTEQVSDLRRGKVNVKAELIKNKRKGEREIRNVKLTGIAGKVGGVVSTRTGGM